MSETSNKTLEPGIAFLLSQLGAHSAALFAGRIAPLNIKPYHAGILRILGTQEGMTQQALCGLLGIFPSRLVGLLDELQKLKLIERRETPEDRRTYALYLTKAGREALLEVVKLTRLHQDDLCAALNKKEQKVLQEMLTRIVAQQQITPAVHPGFRQMSGG